MQSEEHLSKLALLEPGHLLSHPERGCKLVPEHRASISEVLLSGSDGCAVGRPETRNSENMLSCATACKQSLLSH